MDTRTRRSPWELVILFAYPILLFGLAAFSVLVVPWACLSRDQGRHRSMRTQARIQQAAAVANQWHGQFGRFPPADEAGLARLLHMSAGALPNDSNVGVEVLGLAFAWPEFHAEAGFGAEDASNTDADAYAPAWGGEAPLAELRDGWGNPLAYFVHTRYAQADANPAAYVLARIIHELA